MIVIFCEVLLNIIIVYLTTWSKLFSHTAASTSNNIQHNSLNYTNKLFSPFHFFDWVRKKCFKKYFSYLGGDLDFRDVNKALILLSAGGRE